MHVTIDADRIATVSYPSSFTDGCETFRFRVADPWCSNEQEVTFCVKPHCPIITPVIEDQLVEAGEAFPLLLLDLHVTDDFDPLPSLTWSATGNTNLGVSIDPTTHQVTVTYPVGFVGCEDITFHVVDRVGCEAEQMVRFCVHHNCPMVYPTIPSDTVWASETFPTIDLNSYVSGANGLMTWSVTGGLNLTATINAGHLVTITYPANFTDGCESFWFFLARSSTVAPTANR